MEPTPEILDTTVIGQLKDEIIVLKEKKLQLEMKIMDYETVSDMAKRHIDGLNSMIESWYKLINSDLDPETKLQILKSAISAYTETQKTQTKRIKNGKST